MSREGSAGAGDNLCCSSGLADRVGKACETMRRFKSACRRLFPEQQGEVNECGILREELVSVKIPSFYLDM